MQFVLASHNKKKLAELSSIVSSLGIEIIPLPEGAPEPEENGKTFEENAIIKAKSAAEFTGLPALADDSGLCVDALDGAPGIYSARYCEGTDEDRNAFLLKNMQDKETVPAGSCAPLRACWRTAKRSPCAVNARAHCSARITAQAASATTRCSMSRNTAVPSANCRQRSRIQSLIGQTP